VQQNHFAFSLSYY